MDLLDFTIQLTNITKEVVTIQGATDKGYGGFKFRLDATHKPFIFNGDDGEQKRDAWLLDTPWVDTLWTPKDSNKTQGVAIFQHPKNHDFPHDGWMLRHYGIVGPAWPHEQAHLLQPDESVTLRYRILIHDGTTESAKIAEKYQVYGEFAQE